MELGFDMIDVGGKAVAEVTSGVVATERDATDLVGNASFGGAVAVLIDASHLAPEFSDLSSGLAGVVLQKFSNYRLPLVVTGFDEAAVSDSMRALMAECRRGGSTRFMATKDQALTLLADAAY